ncbi:MAG: acyltransferase [Verrucomicrobiales bacterium]|nr:acyltransferase [Verrucomicrobiota bacterium JB025]
MKQAAHQRAMNLCIALWNQVRWSWRFGAFGFRSRLACPDLVLNARRIRIGRQVLISKGARIEAIDSDRRGEIEIGDGTSIQMYFHCGAAESVKIGRDVLIAGRVYITDHDHKFDHPELPPRRCRELVTRPVVVEDGAWLGEGCVILKGVRVGARAVVGANAVVTRDVAPGAVVGGIPAKEIKRIDFSRPPES